MNSPIDGYVSGLNDFPLDPDSGNAWLWSADGNQLLWASTSACQIFGLGQTDTMPALVTAERFRGLSADLNAPRPDQQPVRAQQITLRHGSIARGFTCLSRPVRLKQGGYGVLAVAIGASSRVNTPNLETTAGQKRSSSQERTAGEERTIGEAFSETVRPRRAFRLGTSSDEAINGPTGNGPTGQPVDELRQMLDAGSFDRTPVKPGHDTPLEQPTALVRRETRDAMPAASSSAATFVPSKAWTNPWIDEPRDKRHPLRFVWQTDAQGRFVHISRELSEAVGPSHAMIIGQNIEQAARRLGLSEISGIAKGLAGRETWSAPAALWPVEGAEIAVPMEMAGMPVLEQGQFAGFRGYGIARIERSVPLSGSAIEALSEDRPVQTETAHSHFGPAIEQALTQAPSHDPAPVPPSKAETVNPLPILAPSTETVRTEAAQAAAPKPVVEPDVPKKTLSTTEREAFREIARALEKIEDRQAVKPEVTAPAVRESHEQEKTDQLNPEPVKAGSLEALKKDLAKRSRLRLGATSVDEPDLPVTNTPKAPVIPYDALQARREQKGRADVPQAPWSTIMDNLPIGLMVTQNGQTVYANRFLLDLTGYPDFDSFQNQMGASGLFTAADNPRTGKNPANAYAILNRRGETIKVDATIQSTFWNEAPATLTSIRTMTEAATPQVKALELDLISARSELRELQSVLDTATDGIVSIDLEGRILGMNRSAEALFGFDQSELIGEPMTVLLEPESHVAALDYLEGLKSNGVRSIMNDGRDVKGRERKGGILPLFMTIGTIGDNARLSRFCVVLRDITHWKKVETDLLEAKRQAEDSSSNKTDFLTMISHEIRTPLNAILGFSQVMMSESFGPIGSERYKQYARDINASGEHVISLVNDLLNLSKVASGKLEMTFGSVDVNAVVAACVAMIQPQANAGKVIVRSQLSAHLPQIVADERAVRQIVINLLSNAAKFTDAGGQVIASTTFTDQGEVTIRVRDTGIGMSEDEIKRAMEPFRQVNGPRSSGGTGLGLPLTKALVEANRARFAIQSGSNEGTLVEVIFPSTRVLAE